MHPTLSDREIAAVAGELYQSGPWALRTLNRLRPFICPFGPLLQEVPMGSTVLDVGCGGGLFLGLLGRRDQISTGIGFDSSRQAIDLAKEMAMRLPPTVSLEFQCVGADEPWPITKPVDVVSVIDVMHHIPPDDQRTVIERAARAVRPGGKLIYKDMVEKPAWRATANRLHDLVLARQWIHYLPMDRAIAWAEQEGFRLTNRGRLNRYWYGHEMAVFERADAQDEAHPVV